MISSVPFRIALFYAAVFLVIGVRPAENRMGTFSRAAFMMPQMPLAVPTETCSITACGRPVASAGC